MRMDRVKYKFRACPHIWGRVIQGFRPSLRSRQLRSLTVPHANKSMHRFITTCMLLICSFCFMQAQESVLDQWAFTSETDSVQLKNHIDENTNYVFSIYGDWCYPCKQELKAWKSQYAKWKADYNLEIVVLDDFNEDNILAALDSLEKEYPYKAFVTKRIHPAIDVNSFPTNIFVTGKSVVYMESGQKDPSEMETLFVELFTKVKTPILDAALSQKQLFMENCAEAYKGVQSEESDTVIINSQRYRELYSEEFGESYFLRESEDLNYVYLYDRDSEEEHVLFDYTKGICEEIELYSPLLKRNVKTIVVDVYCIGQRTYYELDIPYSECFGVSKYYTLVTGLGSNAGIIPVFDEFICYSSLICQFEDDLLSYEHPESEDCAILSSTDQGEFKSDLEIYPNPTQGEITIKHPSKKIEKIKVYGLLGHCVYTYENASQTIVLSLNGIERGVYFLELSIDNRTVVKKVQLID